MRYARKILADGERVVHQARQHVFAVGRRAWPWFLLAAAGAAATVYAQIALEPGTRLAPAVGGGAALLVGCVVAGAQLLAWRHQEYLVTTRRVVKSEGVFSKRIVETSLEKINDARLEQSWLGRLFGYGDLDLLTAAEEGSIDDFRMLARPVAFQHAIANERERLLHG